MKFDDRKDCPFCDNSWGPPQTEQSAPGGRYRVGCMNPHCGASSGFCDSAEEALALWNKRPTQANNADMSPEK